MANCTVAIPVFNHRAYVAHAVRSALDQDISGLDIIVVDNCSTDGTWELLQQFTANGVKLHRNPSNIGLFGNFNRCLELSSSSYVRLLCADDRLPPRCLGREVSLMEAHPGAVMLSARGQFVNPSGTGLGRIADDFPPGIYDGRSVPTQWLGYYAHYRRNPLNYPSGVLLRARRLRGSVKFDEQLATAGDIDFYFRVLRHGDLIISDTLGSYVTRHAGQTHVGPNLDGTAVREQLALIEEFGGRPGDAAARERLRGQLAGMCLGLALHRSMSANTRASARIHRQLARTIAPDRFVMLAGLAKIAACHVARVLLGRRAPFIPAPMRLL